MINTLTQNELELKAFFISVMNPWPWNALKPSLLRYNEGFIQLNSFYIPKEHDCVRNGHTDVLNKRLGNVFRLCSIRYSDLERKQPRRC